MNEYLSKYQDFVYFLRFFSGYEYTDSPGIEPVHYQGATSPELLRLRETLKLDDVAGSGPQWNQLRRLNRWLHETIRHDGSTAFPHEANALTIFEVCRAETRGVNCRMLATALNEMCLSLGWKSRFVTCLPMGEDFKDCHVVTQVYIDEWQKWVFIDPTWDAFVENSQGMALSLAELRDGYITGQELHVSDGLNWNGESGDATEYLAYMAKNTFRFSTNAISEYGAEGKAEFTQYWLHPMSYHPTTGTLDVISGDRIVHRSFVSNPVQFWS